MLCQVFDTPVEAAQHAAGLIAKAAARAVAARGYCTLALSGGRTPAPLLEALARKSLDWTRIHVFQVDERIAPEASGQRNLVAIERSLVRSGTLPGQNLHRMPVEADDLQAAAGAYARQLASIAGTPPCLDVVHLGLGADGHTASLVPGDPALDVTETAVALTGPYQGLARMTLTFPVLDAAQLVLFFVTGADKQAAMARLVACDPVIPASRINQDRIILVVDRTAMPTIRL